MAGKIRPARWFSHGRISTGARGAHPGVPNWLEEKRGCLFLVLHEEMFRGIKQAEVDRDDYGEDGQHLKFVHFVSPERVRVT